MTTTTILAGEFKGTKLFIGRSIRIRPTQSRIRKCIFDILSEMNGKDVLDLYAGAGSLGFEALSRGANSVTFVDSDIQAIRVLNRNKLHFSDCNITIVKQDCFRFLRNTESKYHVILADPPYGKVDLPMLKTLALDRLRENGTLLIESSVRQDWVDSEAIIKRYGDTQISIFRREI